MNTLALILGPALVLGLGGFGLITIFGNHDPGQVFPNAFTAVVAGLVLAAVGLALGIAGALARWAWGLMP